MANDGRKAVRLTRGECRVAVTALELRAVDLTARIDHAAETFAESMPHGAVVRAAELADELEQVRAAICTLETAVTE